MSISRLTWQILSCATLLLNLVSIDAAEPRTGCLPPSDAESAAFAAQAQQIAEIRYNALARQRMATASPLAVATTDDAVAIGEELVFTGADQPLSALAVPTKVSLPPAVDNSTLDAFPPIADQGQLGSCASFSTSYYLLTHMTALVRGWDAKNLDGDDDPDLVDGDEARFSTSWTYNLINGGKDKGSSLQAAISLVMKHGAATLAEMPYTTDDHRWWSRDAAVWRTALTRRPGAYGTLYNLDSTDGLYVLKQLLANGYVLTFATGNPAFDWQVRDMSGTKIVYCADGFSGGHGMTIVGYDDDRWCDVNGNGTENAGEYGCLKIANSWGASNNHGMNDGFYWIAYDALRPTSAVADHGGTWPVADRRPAFNSANWLLPRAAYTPQLVAQFTLHHPQRNGLRLQLGMAAAGAAEPDALWTPQILRWSGGPYAFDGTTTTCNGSFALDFTDLAPPVDEVRRYFLRVASSSGGGDDWVHSFTLVDAAGTALASADGLPVLLDDGSLDIGIDHSYHHTPACTIAIATITDTASESGGDALMRLTRDGTDGRLVVNLDRSGTAGQDDFMLLRNGTPVSGSVVFANGESHIDITVRAIDDVAFEGRETLIVHLAPGSDYAVDVDDHTATVFLIDDDQTQITLGAERVYVPEGGSAQVGIRLTAAPSGPVTVHIEKDYGEDLSVSAGSELVFDSDDWDHWQQVSFACVDDPDDRNGTGKFWARADGIEDVAFWVQEIDDDAVALELAATQVLVPENGTATVDVRLSAAPATDRIVTAACNGDADLAIVGDSSLVFTSANWQQWQSITVQAADDPDGHDGTAFCLLSLQGSTVSVTCALWEVDDDPPSFALLTNPTAVSVPECGTSTFTVRLSMPPSETVHVVTTRLSGDTDLEVTGGASLQFDAETWAAPQTLTVAARQDSDMRNNSAILQLEASGQAQALLTAWEQDADQCELEIETSSIAVVEGGTASLRARLRHAPIDAVTYLVERREDIAYDADLSVVGANTMSFSPDDWHQWRSVTLAASQDDDSDNGTATFLVTAPELGQLQGVSVTEIDDELVQVVLDREALVVTEGETLALGMRLTRAPGGPHAVSANLLYGTAAEIDGSTTLNFDDDTWQDWQSLTITGLADEDMSDDSDWLQLDDGSGNSRSLPLQVIDRDAVAIEVDPGCGHVPEGGSMTLRLRLDAEPTDEVTVNVYNGNGDQDLDLGTTNVSLSFTGEDYDQWQTVVVYAAEDDDAVDGWRAFNLWCSAGPSHRLRLFEWDHEAHGTLRRLQITLSDDLTMIETAATIVQQGANVYNTEAVTHDAAPLAGNEDATVHLTTVPDGNG